MLAKKPPSPQRRQSSDSDATTGLSSLPYDLLLNISTYLDLRDVHALHRTCRALYDASTTRTVYRKLANDLLRRCRALPLKGFQRLSDLTTEQLIRSVNKATHYESAWRFRAPRPVHAGPHNNQGINPHSSYMDVTPGGPLSKRMLMEGDRWYKVVSAPPGEEVDWLSPITSSYTLCATKSGKVVCWDVQTDTCLAEWNPGARWELWKCRVEFEERTVFFTMAKVLAGSYDDDRVMEFVLMRLTFSDGPSGESSSQPPVFSHVTDFRTTGVVMNVFLLDPSERLLSAFIWVSAHNTIGLYALPDWDKKEYVFIDTGIECVMSSNWSCILYQQHIVIHCEESEAAYQHFYPLSLLRQYTSKLATEDSAPTISCRLPPSRTLKKKFVFPLFADFTDSDQEEGLPPPPMTGYSPSEAEDELGPPYEDGSAGTSIPIVNGDSNGNAIAGPSTAPVTSAAVATSSSSSSSASSSSSNSSLSSSSSSPSSLIITSAPQPPDRPNPFPFPPWYPESAHFVRQWWPSLPNIPRVSCTVVLLAAHDPQTHRTRFVLAQHYFRVPLDRREWVNGGEAHSGDLPAVGVGVEEDEQEPEADVDVLSTVLTLGSGTSIPITTGVLPTTNGTGSRANGVHTVNGSSSSTNGTHHAHHAHHNPRQPSVEDIQDDALMHLWYVDRPFEVVRVFDGPEEDEDGAFTERPRPLVAVDFGHAVWIEYMDADDADEGEVDEDVEVVDGEEDGSMGDETEDGNDIEVDEGADADTEVEGEVETEPTTPTTPVPHVDQDPKRLRFVTFPPFAEEFDAPVYSYPSKAKAPTSCHTPPPTASTSTSSSGPATPTPMSTNYRFKKGVNGLSPGVVYTLPTPPGLQLGMVETINIDQSQGAVILSDKGGKIWILCYE